MNSARRRNSENDRQVNTCFGNPRECYVHSFVLTASTFIFVISMILAVYLTQNAGMDKIVVVLIVSSCLLYILGFISNVYHIYYTKHNRITCRNGRNFNGLIQAPGISAQNSSSSGRPPDILGFAHPRQPIRNTPPPPYEIQMSEMSRLLLSGTPQTTNVTTRESEITEEARKLIKKMYEEVKRAEQQATQSPRKEQYVQQVVQTPEIPARQQERIVPIVSHPDLIVSLQDTVVKSVPVRGFPRSKQKVAANSLPSQLDLERLVIGSEECTTALPQSSPRGEDFLQVARKRKLAVLPKELPTRPKTRGKTFHAVVDDDDTQKTTYDRIEVVKNISSINASQPAYGSSEYCCIDSEVDDSSEQASSVCSAASKSGTVDQKRKFRVKEPRKLSASTTRKFRQLGQSPETVLDAIATCFDLTPDEWMTAWKLCNKGVSPIERARILGVCLHDNSSNYDN